MKDRTLGRCHNCGKYFEMHTSPDSGTTCSEKCHKEYVSYLNFDKDQTMGE